MSLKRHSFIWLFVGTVVGIFTLGMSFNIPLPWTESLAMPEAVPVSGRVRNFKVCGHVNMVSRFNINCLFFFINAFS